MIDIVKISINPWLIGLFIVGYLVFRVAAQRVASSKPIAIPRDESDEDSKKKENED